MKSRIIAYILCLGLITSLVVGFFSVGHAQEIQNNFFLDGFIIPPTSWKGGNSGKVQFFTGGQITSGRDPYFDQDGKLFGNFWLGSSGWVAFNHGIPEQEVKITCPEGIIEDTTKSKDMVCPITGSVWSENAGWIILSGSTIGNSNKGVYYNPNSANIEGFGWSESLGWVPVFSGVKFDDEELKKDKPDDDFHVGSGSTNQTNWYETVENPAGGASVNFIGKVAVIGNIAGSKVFSVVNQHGYNNQKPGYKYDTVQHAPIINRIRENIAQLTRNLTKDGYITTPHGKFIFNEEKDYCITENNDCYEDAQNLFFSGPSSLNVNYKDVQTIIVRGHDVIINADFNATTGSNGNIQKETPSSENMKTIIALKDEKGNGGNVYITKNVGKIYAYIVAEGSVFSGEKKKKNNKLSGYSYIEKGEFQVPQKQLYINGIVISKNTIGGVGENSVCPVLINCSFQNAKNYDMSYFRNYNPNDATQANIPPARKNLIEKIKKATVIIDYNPNILYSPPVGLEKFQ